MRNKIIILLFFLSGFAFGQSVPNTTTFHLTDVTAVVGGTSLSQAFTNSVDSYFDPAYKGSKDRLSNFRNYTIPTPSTPVYPSGKYIAVAFDTGYIYTSTNYGVSWTERNPEGTRLPFTGIATDSTGQYITASIDNYFLLRSNNGGVSWSIVASPKHWVAISMSKNAKYQTAAVASGYLYISVDSGKTWTQKNFSAAYTSISVSSSGQYQAAGIYGGHIFYSQDYGSTWVSDGRANSYNWSGIYTSPLGITGVIYGDGLYTTSDYINWYKRTSNQGWSCVSGNINGLYQTAGLGTANYFYYSSNGGGTWTLSGQLTPGATGITSISVSSSGQYQAAVIGKYDPIVSTNQWDVIIFISSDYGHIWSGMIQYHSNGNPAPIEKGYVAIN